MFCSKCGTKNESKAKFCEKCGNKLEYEVNEPSKKSKLKNAKNRIKNISKKAKIGIISAIIIAIIAIIVLAILLNNPVKKVENYLTNYYENYQENYNNNELVKIGDILKSNKNEKKTLESISKQINKTISNWVKNFNKSYTNEDELNKSYTKLSGVLKEIESYFNGLEYVLSYEDYYKYTEEIYDLYISKNAYFQALEASDDYDKYSYYSKVIENDNYYKEANEFVTNYLKDEIAELKKGVEKLTSFESDASNSEKLEAYLSVLEYLKDNEYKNNINLSETSEYKELYDNATKNIVEYTKLYAEELQNALQTNDIMAMIDESLEVLEYDTDAYEQLENLKNNYQEKLPDSLISKYLVSSTIGTNDSSYRITINDKEYDSYVSFSFKGQTVTRVYRLNNEYKTFKANIVKGPDWDSDFNGEIIIYGDNKELYRSGKITKNGELNSEINIDITDVDDLKIEFVTESKSDGWADFYIYLVEPYLYK